MTAALLLLVLSLLSASAVATSGGLAPVHSWKTLPVYLHSSNRSGMWNATALKIIEKYPMLVIEKWHCQGPLSSQPPYAPPSTEPCSKLTQEARMIEQCAVVKRGAPQLSCIFYMNAAIDFEWYQLHQTMLQHEGHYLPDWALRYQNGSFVTLTSRETFNFANASMAAEFGATCARAISTGSVDGCFIDRSDPEWQTAKWGKGTPPGSQYDLAEYTAHKIATLQSMQAAAGDGPIIMNCHSCIDERKLPPIGNPDSYTNAQNIECETSLQPQPPAPTY